MWFEPWSSHTAVWHTNHSATETWYVCVCSVHVASHWRVVSVCRATTPDERRIASRCVAPLCADKWHWQRELCGVIDWQWRQWSEVCSVTLHESCGLDENAKASNDEAMANTTKASFFVVMWRSRLTWHPFTAYSCFSGCFPGESVSSFTAQNNFCVKILAWKKSVI